MEPSRRPWVDWLMQMSANLVGTVLAAGVIYVVGVVAGAIKPNDALNVLSLVVAGGTLLPALYVLWRRWHRGY